MTSFEVPGFHLVDAPRFNGASGTTLASGEYPEVSTVLDLAMVFGSRLWGHELPFLVDVASAAPGCGDLYTHELREQACRALCERVGKELRTPAGDWRSLVLHSGSEAVETAIKTALRATRRERIVAFEGGYHGTFGLALAVTHRAEFRAPWAAQLPDTVSWTAWGAVPQLDEQVACVVLEPWQGRAGVIPPPAGFLAAVRAECDRVGALLVLDAVLCGAGRTGPTIAEGIGEARPDLLCLGKALGAGVPASAVVMRRALAEDAWEQGPVEPAHTSTHLGDPVASAGVLHALIRLDRDGAMVLDAANAWHRNLEAFVDGTPWQLRGTGLLWALDSGVDGAGFTLAGRLLHEHRIAVVPSGPTSSGITLYPSATCTGLERDRFLDALVNARP